MTIVTTDFHTTYSTFKSVRSIYLNLPFEGEESEKADLHFVKKLFRKLDKSGFKLTDEQASVYLFNHAYARIDEKKAGETIGFLFQFCDRLFPVPVGYDRKGNDFMRDVYEELLRSRYGGEENSKHDEIIEDVISELELYVHDRPKPFGRRFNPYASLKYFRAYALKITDKLIHGGNHRDREGDCTQLSACLSVLEMLVPHRF